MGKAYKIHRSRDRRRDGRGGKRIGDRNSPSSESVAHSIPEEKDNSPGRRNSRSPDSPKRGERGGYRGNKFSDRVRSDRGRSDRGRDIHQSSRANWKNHQYRTQNTYSDYKRTDDRDRDRGSRDKRDNYRDKRDDRRDDRRPNNYER